MNLNLEALEESFDAVAPRGDELMDEFYGRLFAAAPAVKPLFAGTDMRRQKAMLLSALVLVRKSLRDLDSIVPKRGSSAPAMWATAPGRSTIRSSPRC
jgi:hemoglobin-like flavoprotein